MIVDNFPFKVGFNHRTFKEKAAMAHWCAQQLDLNAYRHDHWEFVFRREEDYLQFLLAWS